MRPRFLAALGVGVGLAAGGATALTVGMPGLAGATAPAATAPADDGTTPPPEPSTGPADDPTTVPDPPADAAPSRRGAALEEILQPLVDDGTLTEAQADQVIAALREARAVGSHGPQWQGPFGPGGPGGPVHGRLLAGLDAAAEALGLSADDLHEALAEGRSLADVAATQGVDVQRVIDALVAEASTLLDDAVADGKLTAEQAAERAEDLTERITDLVEREGGLRPGRRADHDHPDAPPAPDAPDTTTSTPDTTTGD